MGDNAWGVLQQECGKVQAPTHPCPKNDETQKAVHRGKVEILWSSDFTSTPLRVGSSSKLSSSKEENNSNVEDVDFDLSESNDDKQVVKKLFDEKKPQYQSPGVSYTPDFKPRLSQAAIIREVKKQSTELQDFAECCEKIKLLEKELLSVKEKRDELWK